jgi:2-dehydro-3-deoxygluconokinase
MIRAICAGECMVELRGGRSALYERSFAGDVYNTAVYLKRSDPAINVEFCTATGEDPLSQDMRDSWKHEGIQTSLAYRVAGHMPGLYLIEIDPNGERTFYYWRRHSAATLWWQRLQAHGAGSVLGGADLIYFSGISLAILSEADRHAFLAELHGLRNMRERIAFDPNLRATLWPSLERARAATEEAVSVSGIVLPSCEDMDTLYGPTSPAVHTERLMSLGALEVALTAGVGGCWLHGNALIHVPQMAPATACDTSGAGDSFNGAYLAARLNGQQPVRAATAGLQLASLVVTHRGAIIPKHLT